MTPTDPSVFADYRTAIARKLKIARFHRRHLAEVMGQPRERDQNLPPVAIQAHFEGAVGAVVSMADQLAAGIAAALDDMPPLHAATLAEVLNRLTNRAPDRPTRGLIKQLSAFRDDALLNDARDIRNRARHRFYDKYDDQRGWYVEPPQYIPDDVKQWIGDRHLLPYVDATIELAYEILEGSNQANVWITEICTE